MMIRWTLVVPILVISTLQTHALSFESQERPVDDAAVILSAGAVREDLDAFQKGLEERWSYLRANDVDYQSAIDTIREKGSEGMSVQELGIEAHKVIALFIDGHARVDGFEYPGGYLPFLIDLVGDRFVAFKEDRSSLIDPERPFITKLDGKPIGEWLDAADAFIAEGSSQYKLTRGVRFLRYLQFLRGELGVETKPTVDIEVVSEDGEQAKTVTLDITDRMPEYGEWPMRDSQLFESNIGYLRITRMRSWAVDLVDKWTHYFRDTEGLIVDVRSNGGGSREALRALFPYLMNEDDRHWINNVGVYRLYRGYEPHHMTARFMYREDSPHWTAEEKAAIEEFRHRWKPQWEPPDDEFSQWHYMIMSRRINPKAYTYAKPVVILMDYRCFSATDIFLSTLKGWRNVTLVGTPSGGGSALSQYFELPQSGLRVRIGSMVSFQRNGKLHDGNGTHPDVKVERAPESFLRLGSDNQLEKALRLLKPADVAS